MVRLFNDEVICGLDQIQNELEGPGYECFTCNQQWYRHSVVLLRPCYLPECEAVCKCVQLYYSPYVITKYIVLPFPMDVVLSLSNSEQEATVNKQQQSTESVNMQVLTDSLSS